MPHHIAALDAGQTQGIGQLVDFLAGVQAEERPMSALLHGVTAALVVSTAPAQMDSTVIDARITKLWRAEVTATDTRAFAFDIDRPLDMCGSRASSASRETEVAIPGDGVDEFANRHRDLVATARLAHRLGRPVTLSLDGCVGGVARVVGLEIQ
jgi:hypothetical protein